MKSPMHILFVCTGNVSRSYLAEMLLKHEIIQHHLYDIFVASAGILAYSGIAADPVMIEYLSSQNILTGDHISRTIGKEDIEWADHIFVMEQRHREFIKGSWPEADHKVERLGKYISPEQPEDDIIDPYGKSLYHYRVVQSQISAAVKTLFTKVVQNNLH
jgi:protein-tyrosine-phosphatase